MMKQSIQLISLTAFLLANTPGISALASNGHIHSHERLACSSPAEGCCCHAVSHDDADEPETCSCHVSLVQGVAEAPVTPFKLPCPACPCSPGGCCFCSVAKVPCVHLVVAPDVHSPALEQTLAELSCLYSSPFCGKTTPPPKA